MAKSKELNYKIKPGNPMILGAAKTNEGINFALMVNNGERKPCSLILYEKGTMKVVSEIAFSNEMWYGNICTMCLGGINLNDFDYNYRIGNRIVTDPYATLINGAKVFGDNDSSKKTSAVHVDRFKWEDDRKPMTDFCDSIIYRLHVRGFTMDRFSGVKKKGTFAGVAEKIPYFKELGITMVELMPAYEFNENFGMKSGKVNYWGYTTADYFMPKVAFSNKKDAKSAINEFKTLVKELHKNNIEICMEFFFEEGISPAYMIDCFRYWVINYHIDGIHCNMSDDIRGAVSSDPYLSNAKIISYGFDNPNYAYNKNLGEYNDVFMNVSRKFLKGDEGTVKDMAFRVRYNKDFATPINFIATNNTFTMMDMVSYSSKHNQDNGELNRDGREDNYSWNCGVEGMTKGKKTNEFRMKQLKNAFCMLMLSQGAPLIYAGDEFGNTANGNNNPYCQDNETSYIKWRSKKKNEELFEFVKFLIEFRKSHDMLHMGTMPHTTDYRSVGTPEMSYHSDRTWALDTDLFTRHFAYMLNGKYLKVYNKSEDESLYIAFNMYWEERKFGLPSAGKGRDWEVCFVTSKEEVKIDDRHVKFSRSMVVPKRSVAVLVSRENEEVKQEEEHARKISLKLAEETRKRIENINQESNKKS